MASHIASLLLQRRLRDSALGEGVLPLSPGVGDGAACPEGYTASKSQLKCVIADTRPCVPTNGEGATGNGKGALGAVLGPLGFSLGPRACAHGGWHVPRALGLQSVLVAKS